MVVPTRNRTVIIDGIILTAPNLNEWRFEIIDQEITDEIILTNEFLPGSTRLLVDGSEWCPDWYSEEQDEQKKWKKLKLNYPIPAGSKCWVRYYYAPINTI